MHLVHVCFAGLFLHLYLDRATDNNVQRPSVRQQANIVVEHAARVEEWNGEAEDLFKDKLRSVDGGVAVLADLLIQIIFLESL